MEEAHQSVFSFLTANYFHRKLIVASAQALRKAMATPFVPLDYNLLPIRSISHTSLVCKDHPTSYWRETQF